MQKRLQQRLYGLLLACSVFLAFPTATYALGSTSSFQTEVENAIALSVGDVTSPTNQPITSKKLAELLNNTSSLAGSEYSFEIAESKTVTREQLAILLSDSLGLPDKSEPFIDVEDQSEVAGAIGAVYDKKLMTGVGNQKFNPKALVTEAQAYAVTYRVFQYAQPFQLTEATIQEIQDAVSEGRLTYKDLTQMYLDRINQYDDNGIKLSAVINVNPDALQIAEELDQERITKGIRGPLHGIPVLVKDNFSTTDMPTTGGCICLEDSVPTKDSFTVQKLREAGAIIIGKTNLDEFANGAAGGSSLGGQTLNPYALDRVPGGSSAGTGAAIAANFATIGFGTDTGGSIRIPASFNSLVGIRPTIGLTSRAGIIPLGLTQDTGGPLARTVTDAAIALDATIGYDPDDLATAYSVGRTPESYTAFLDKDGLKGARIGVATELFGTSPEELPVTNLIYEAVEELKALGATVVEVKIPNLEEILAFPSVSGYEFKTQLNDYLATYAPNAKYKTLTEIINSGEFYKPSEEAYKARDLQEVNSQEYKDLLLNRTPLARESILKLLADSDLDAIVYPSTAQEPALIGGVAKIGTNVRLSAYTGFPSISVPAGFTAQGLPQGIEFLGRDFDEGTLIKLAYAYEQGTLHRKAPVLTP